MKKSNKISLLCLLFSFRPILWRWDSIYLYSDGYADQFGGSKGKKFKYKQLDDLIIKQKHIPMKEQKVLLKKHFLQWIGSLEQVDDVCVFGVKI